MIRKLTLKKEREHETNEASIAGNVMRDLIAHVTNDNLIGRKIKSGELRKKTILVSVFLVLRSMYRTNRETLFSAFRLFHSISVNASMSPETAIFCGSPEKLGSGFPSPS